MRAVVSGRAPGFFTLWLAFWVWGEAWVLLNWLWMLRGQEIVEIAEGELTGKRDLFGHGPTKHWPRGTVQNIRASGVYLDSAWNSRGMNPWNQRFGTVAFESAGQTQRFGLLLQEAEAQQVVSDLRAMLGA